MPIGNLPVNADGTPFTQILHDVAYGVVATVEAADSVLAVAGKTTNYTYNAIRTRVVLVEQPQDNANQWVLTGYDGVDLTVAYSVADLQLVKGPLFATKTVRPDIGSWSIAPVVSVTVYDNNGNVTEQWQADPADLTFAEWNGDTGSGGYYQLSALAYDRLGRLTQSTQYVDWSQTASVASLVSQFFYDANGNRIRSRGPGYDVSATTYYDYSFVEYDDANRVVQAYNAVASTNASLTSVPGGTKFTQTLYDLPGNAVDSQDWTKAYDAMGRLVSLETLDPGGGTFTQTLTLNALSGGRPPAVPWN